MISTFDSHVPPAAWNSGLVAARPIPLAEEIGRLPSIYRDRRPNEILSISSFYQKRIAGQLDTDDLDKLAKAYLEVKHPSNRYYYGYLTGNDHRGKAADYPIRVIGFIPQAEIRGVVLHAKGFGHTAWENNPDLPGKFMELGLAYFSFDLPGHGMSVRPYDPSVSAFRSSKLFVEHTRQVITCVNRITQQDPCLKGKPLFGIGSSLGATAMTGALAAMIQEGQDAPFERLVFDSPFWSFGSDWPSWKRFLMKIAFWGSSYIPSLAFHKKGPPQNRESLAEGFYEENLAAYQAFGPTLIPLPMFDLPNLLDANEDALRKFSEKMSPAALFVFEGDTQVDPQRNKDIFRNFRSDQVSCIVSTGDHSAFAARDPHLLTQDGILRNYLFAKFSDSWIGRRGYEERIQLL